MGFWTTGQNFEAVLPEVAGSYLILDAGLRIAAASPEYVRTTLLWNQEIAGRNFFEVFPENPQNPSSDGAHNLNASFRYVFRNGRPHRMKEQRYDVRDRVGNGAWVEKYWLFENTPVFREGTEEISHLMHGARDVTDGVLLRQWIGERMVSIEEQRATLEQMLQDLTDQYRAFSGARDVLAHGKQSDSLAVEELRSALGAPLTRMYFRPSETVPTSGIYSAFHIGGCEAVRNTIYRTAGGTFSPCPRCKESVYYRLHRSV